MNSLGRSGFPRMPTTDWFAQHAISVRLTCPSVAPVMATTVVLWGSHLAADRLTASSVMYSLPEMIRNSFTLPELIQGTVPPDQNDGSEREGVPPNNVFALSPRRTICHPEGILPMAVSCMRDDRARTRSKSTNQDLNTAWTM